MKAPNGWISHDLYIWNELDRLVAGEAAHHSDRFGTREAVRRPVITPLPFARILRIWNCGFGGQPVTRAADQNKMERIHLGKTARFAPADTVLRIRTTVGQECHFGPASPPLTAEFVPLEIREGWLKLNSSE